VNHLLQVAAAVGTSLVVAGVPGCRSHPPVTHVIRRFDELLRPHEAGDALSTAGCAHVAIDNEIRPVVAQPVTLADVEGVRLTQAAPQAFRTHALDGLAAPLPAVQASVRQSGGEWQARDVFAQGIPEQRYVAVRFTDADVQQAFELALTSWAPPSPLDVSTDKFVVPPNARLRFGVAVRSDVPGRADFRVSVQSAGVPSRTLFSRSLDSLRAADVASWQDVEISLTEVAGREVQLRFEARVTTTVSLQGAPFPPPRALISTPELVTAAPDDSRFNVVLVSIDTLRADHVGAYGYRRPISPAIDRLAAGGTVFENVIAAWPETSASHMTMFTGLYPSVHGVGITAWGATTLPPWQHTLAEIFRRAGYVTAAITEDGLLDAARGFPRGFERYREFAPSTTKGPASMPHAIDGILTSARTPGEAQRGFALATDWLRRYEHDRFFLFLHTYQVHQRSAPGARYDALRQSFVHDGFTPEIPSADHFVATYDAAIAYTDEALQGLLRTLDALQLTRRTLLIVTSDHGEAFFEHGTFGHGQSLYDPEVRVPCVLYCPGFIPSGKRIGAQVGLIDLAPTIAELLHVPPLTQFQGRSAADLVVGTNASARDPVVCELGDHWRAVRTNASKLIRMSQNGATRTEFYDLRQDPAEARPIAVDGNPQAQEALRILQAHDVECQAIRAQLQAVAPAGGRPVSGELDDNTRERLRALGYDVSK